MEEGGGWIALTRLICPGIHLCQEGARKGEGGGRSGPGVEPDQELS